MRSLRRPPHMERTSHWPYELFPAAHALPLAVSATVWFAPAATAAMSDQLSTSHWPSELLPVALTVPRRSAWGRAGSRARAPAARDASPPSAPPCRLPPSTPPSLGPSPPSYATGPRGGPVCWFRLVRGRPRRPGEKTALCGGRRRTNPSPDPGAAPCRPSNMTE